VSSTGTKFVAALPKCKRCSNPKKAKGFCNTCYMREYRKAHRKEINSSARKYARKHRARVRKNDRIRRARKRKEQKKKFGKRCGMGGCTITKRLCLHHDHRLQKKLKCCASPNGCVKCQICLLCYKHNMVLGMLEDSPKEARKVLRFLERHHVS